MSLSNQNIMGMNLLIQLKYLLTSPKHEFPKKNEGKTSTLQNTHVKK